MRLCFRLCMIEYLVVCVIVYDRMCDVCLIMCVLFMCWCVYRFAY